MQIIKVAVHLKLLIPKVCSMVCPPKVQAKKISIGVERGKIKNFILKECYEHSLKNKFGNLPKESKRKENL